MKGKVPRVEEPLKKRTPGVLFQDTHLDWDDVTNDYHSLGAMESDIEDVSDLNVSSSFTMSTATRFVKVKFFNSREGSMSPKNYTYKTKMVLKPGELVAVKVGSYYKIVEIQTVWRNNPSLNYSESQLKIVQGRLIGA